MNWHNGVGVRPEAVRISREAAAPAAIEARVSAVVFLGPVTHVEMKTASGEALLAQVASGGEPYRPGNVVHVWWDRADELRLPE